MSVKVRIPTPLRKLTNGIGEVDAQGLTLTEVIEYLEQQYPGVRERLCDQDGELRRFINVYIDGEDVRFLDGLATRLKPGSEVSVVPAIAGG